MMKPKGVTKYQATWENEFPWVKPAKNRLFDALCIVCNKNVSIESMGRQAIVSHSKSKKHTELLKAAATSSSLSHHFLSPTSSKSSAHPENSSVSHKTTFADPQPTTSTVQADSHVLLGTLPKTQSTLKDNTINQYLVKDKNTLREIMWCLGAVMSHDSLRVSESHINLFKAMFPETEEVQQLKLSKSKISYNIIYGLGPFFKKQLESILEKCDFYVCGFDESFNKVAQKQQMDVNIRFWNENQNEVCTRYLTSYFLIHANAEALLEAFKSSTKQLNARKILQISMDGPNVNLKFLKLFKEDIKAGEEDDDCPDMLDIGSCGIHKLHCAFKSAIETTEWDVVGFLRSVFYLFQQSPARRGDFIRITNTITFPLKFCSVRWVENVTVVSRVLKIVPQLKMYISESKNKNAVPKCKSFSVVDKFLDDKLLVPKLAFFVFMAENIEPFLREFQTDAPMVPFLHESLYNLCKFFYKYIIKSDIVKSTDLSKIDLKQKDNFQSIKSFELSFGVQEALRPVKGLKEIEVLTFRKNCFDAMVIFVQKLIEKSPLKYSLTEALSALNPRKILTMNGKKNLSSLLTVLIRAKRISGNVADKIIRDFENVSEIDEIESLTVAYDRSEERVDHFWMKLLEDDKWINLRKMIQICLTLSHGNANLERGFSVNKECLAENLHEDSLVAQRNVYDAVFTAGGVKNVNITKPMILATRNAYARYTQACAEKKEKTQELKRKAEERKEKIKEKQQLNAKRSKMINEIEQQRDAVKDIEQKLKSLVK